MSHFSREEADSSSVICVSDGQPRINSELTAEAELKTCGGCSKPLVEPKLLPCLHVLCEACVQKAFKDNDKNRVCPICEVNIAASAEHLLAPTFLFNLRIIEQKQEIQLPNCDLCDATAHASTARCLECEEWMCQLAANIHRRSRCSKNHTLIAAGAYIESLSAPLDSRCPYHDSLHSLYCDHCVRFLCNDCCHTCPQSPRSLEDVKKELVDETEDILQRLVQRVNDQIKLLQLSPVGATQATSSDGPVQHSAVLNQLRSNALHECFLNLEDHLLRQLSAEQYLVDRARRIRQCGSKAEFVMLRRRLCAATSRKSKIKQKLPFGSISYSRQEFADAAQQTDQASMALGYTDPHENPTPSLPTIPWNSTPLRSAFSRNPTPPRPDFFRNPTPLRPDFFRNPTPPPATYLWNPTPPPATYLWSPTPSLPTIPWNPTPPRPDFIRGPTPSPLTIPENPTPSPPTIPENPTPPRPDFFRGPTPSPLTIPENPTPSSPAFSRNPTPPPPTIPWNPTPLRPAFSRNPTPPPPTIPWVRYK